MAPLVLYSVDSSPPCRAVLLALEAAGIKADIHEVNLAEGEHRKEPYLKINPQHTVPTLNDNGFIVWDSHSIVTYLIDKYAKDDSLYPKDLQKRALVNQRLHFDNGPLFGSIRAIAIPILYKGATKVPQEQYDLVKESYEFLEKFLEHSDWLAGQTYTLADTSTIASVSSLTALVPLDNYPKLAAWAKRCETQIPGYATANSGAAQFHAVFGKYRQAS